MDTPNPPAPPDPTTLKHHAPHQGCPDSLACLADSDSKPRDTFATIIRCAILSTPTKRMTLNCIYKAIEQKYPYYHNAGPGWKNTVRHVLSTSQQFEKSRRPITEPGKGGYWSVNKVLTKPDNPRNRRTHRSGRKEQTSSDGAPPGWSPTQESQDYPYLPTLTGSPNDHQSEETQLAPISQIAPPAHFQDPHAYPLVHSMSHVPPLSQYPQPNPLVYGYDKPPDRPGWMAEVSWGTTPMGNVAANGRP